MEYNHLLLTWLKENNERAIKEIFDKNFSRLTAFANNIINNKREAEDIVSSKMCTVWENRHQFTTEDNINAYLYTAVKNGCITYLKSNKIRSGHYKEYAQNITTYEESGVNNKFEAKVVNEKIDQILQELPTKCARVIRLVLQEPDLKPREIARILDIDPKLVRTYKTQGLQQVRALIEKNGSKLGIPVLIILLIMLYKAGFH